MPTAHIRMVKALLTVWCVIIFLFAYAFGSGHLTTRVFVAVVVLSNLGLGVALYRIIRTGINKVRMDSSLAAKLTASRGQIWSVTTLSVIFSVAFIYGLSTPWKEEVFPKLVGLAVNLSFNVFLISTLIRLRRLARNSAVTP